MDGKKGSYTMKDLMESVDYDLEAVTNCHFTLFRKKQQEDKEQAEEVTGDKRREGPYWKIFAGMRSKAKQKIDNFLILLLAEQYKLQIASFYHGTSVDPPKAKKDNKEAAGFPGPYKADNEDRPFEITDGPEDITRRNTCM